MGSLFFAVLGPAQARAQDAQGIANMFGGLIGAAIVEQNKQAWQHLSNDDLTCIALGLEREGQSIQRLISAGISPTDPRLSMIRSTCASVAGRQLRVNVECTINTPQGSFTSRCDEDFMSQLNQRLPRPDALRAAFSNNPAAIGLFERPDSMVRRQQMIASGVTSGTVITPNFDCSKAHLDSEVMICGSAALSKLDAEYGALFRRINPTGKNNPVGARAVALFNERNACGSSEDCIRHNLENSVTYMASVLRKRGETVETSIEQAQRLTKAQAAKALAEERQAAEDARTAEARIRVEKEQQEQALRDAAERQKHFNQTVDKIKDLVIKGSDFLKFDSHNPRVVTIAEAIAEANAALQSNELGRVEAAAETLQRTVEDDPNYSAYVRARADERSRENVRLMAGAIKTAEQQQRFLVSYIAQNPTSPVAAASIGVVKRLKPALDNPDLKQLQSLSAEVEDLLRRYALQDNFLLSLNAVDDKTQATPDAVQSVNLGIVSTDKNRFLLDGNPNDLVLMYVAAPSAPHVVKNLRGDIVFDQGIGSVCIYQKSDLSALRDRVRLAVAKYKLNQLLIQATPCEPNTLLTNDIIATDRGTFLKQDVAYAAVPLQEIEVDHLKPLLAVSDTQIETAIQSIESKRKQIEADIDQSTLDGFALIVLPAVSSGPICGSISTDVEVHQAILGRFKDPTISRLRQHLALQEASFDNVFVDVQRSKCGAVYGNASDLKLLIEAFRRDKISHEFFSETVSNADLEAERHRLAEEKATAEVSAVERRRQVQEENALLSAREADEAKTLGSNQAASRAKYREIAAATAAHIADEIKDFVRTPPNIKTGNLSNVQVQFPHLSDWYLSSLKDQWELQSIDSDVEDYGSADWKGRTLEAAFSTIHIRLKNRLLGDYRDGCFNVGRIIDNEFSITRDPVDATCDKPADLAVWKTGHGFKSYWNF